MALRKEFITSAIVVIALIVVCGLLYPLVITGIGQAAFPGNANGAEGLRRRQARRLEDHRPELRGAGLQERQAGDVRRRAGHDPDPRYFQTRPSGTVPADNAAATSFANYGPNSTITEKAIAGNIATYIQLNGKYYPGGLTAAKVPVDAADTSASGVDPDISVANAHIQAYRIAAVRHLPRATVDHLISKYTAGRGLGFSGEPAVNVLELNLALNRL